MFKRAIDDVSSKGTLFFTERQLYYEFSRRLIRKMPDKMRDGGIVLCVVSTVASVVFTAISGTLFPLIGGMCGVAGGVAIATSSRWRKAVTPIAPVAFVEFKSKYLNNWIDAHGEVEKLLAPAPRTTSGGTAIPSDFSAYSFDRALVTGSREIAAMLVANRFHFENNCAILSRDGYPEHVFDTVMSMLQRNPNLTVFAVHGASYGGLLLAVQMREDHWFPDRTVRIIDLGLRPQHAIKLKLIGLQEATAVTDTTATARLTEEESKWLANGYVVDLAALRPAKLMRAIYQGFARATRDLSSTSSGDDGIVIYSDSGGTWMNDPTADIYASDSFG